MVLLKSLRSPTSLIKEDIEFHKGINVILGKSSGSDESIEDKNGIGKSSLIRLVDFALLADNSKDYFNPDENEFFQGHSIVLEFEVEGETYFIKREMDDPNEPYFGQSLDDLERFETVKDLRDTLEDLFFAQDDYFVGYEKNWFRSLIRFYIKDDLDKKKRRKPTSFIHHGKSDLDHYKYNLFLFGIDNESLVDYKNYSDRKGSLQTERNTLEDNLREETGKSIDEIQTEIRKIEERIDVLEEAIDDKEFLETYEDIEKRIIELSNKISSHVKERQKLRRNLNDLEKSYQYDVEVDVNEIAEIYSSIEKDFGDQVRRELQEVIEMRKNLANNRKKFLEEKEKELREAIDQSEEKISSLEDERSRLYKILESKEEDAFESIKKQYSNLVEEKRQRERLVSKIEQIQEIEREITELNQKITQTISQIREAVEEGQDSISSIYSLYSDIVESSTSVFDSGEIIFNVKPKSAQDSPLDITVDLPKSEAYAKNELRMLAFDLSVFFQTIEENRSTPRFLAHDGVFHGMDSNTVVRILNYVHRFNLKNPDFQYIITGNEEELLVPMESGMIEEEYEFDLRENTIIELQDKPEEMLFEREF